mgnify:FL=1
MSRILRRPMFRGGPVDSRGTGITANLGYQAGGRVGYRDGKLVTIQDILSQTNKNMTGGEILAYANRNNLDLGNNFKINEKSLFPVNESIGMGNFGQSPSELSEALTEGSPYADYLKEDEQDFEKEILASGETTFKLDENFNKIPIIKDTTDLSLAETIAISKDAERDTQGMDLVDLNLAKASEGTSGLPGTNILAERNKKIKGVTEIDPNPQVVGPNGNVKTESTEISLDDIRSQADLFKELLGEDREKELKESRISDLSDYALKFFEGSQKEGATVGSSGAEVAAFATKGPSKTEKTKAGFKKTDQTATVMAINDYLQGKRSKAEIEKLMKVTEMKGNVNLSNQLKLIELKRGNVASRINAATVEKGLPTSVGAIKSILRAEGKPIQIIPKGKEGTWKATKEDEGNYIIEEETKNVYQIINGAPVKLY